MILKRNILIALIAITITACNTAPETTAEKEQYCNKKSAYNGSMSNADSTTSYDFDENYKGCQTSSCAVGNYNEADVVPMAEAKTGDITQCPVSGAIFKVKDDSPVLTHDGKTFHTCCASCGNRFKEDPERFTKNVTLNLKPKHA